MILNDRLVPVERVSLPEPVRSEPARVFVPSEGWETVLFCGASGRVWCLDFSLGARVEARATGIQFPSIHVEAIDFAANRAVVEYDDHLHVFNVSDGRILWRGSADRRACLTPDGSGLIQFERKTTWIWRLDGDSASPQATRLFHAPAIEDYEPRTVARLTTPRGQDAFHVVVGHYGFAVDYAVGYDSSAELMLHAEPRIYDRGFVHDPVEVLHGTRYPFVTLNHGCGIGIKLIDVVEGSSLECPDMAAGPPRAYGRYRRTMLSRDQGEMLVDTANGWGLWDFATNNMSPFCSAKIEPLHFERGCLWAIHADDPGVLLRYAGAIES
jgi:hypothetical protein